MICGFYVLYVLLTPVNFSWAWLGIALCLQFLSFIAHIDDYYDYKHGNRNYWEGDQ
jgi:hypothetical protein